MENLERHIKKVETGLKAFSIYLTKNLADGEDLYQDTLLRIFLNAKHFQEGTNFHAWSTTIMQNLFITRFRKKQRRKTLLGYGANHYLLNSNNRMEQNEGERLLDYEDLMHLVNGLKEETRIPFLLVYEGYKYHEIAKRLDLPEGTVKSKVFYARKQLKQLYQIQY
ncbi:MAG: RNA polymerase sigma factor [Bacteroidota bacterium]